MTQCAIEKVRSRQNPVRAADPARWKDLLSETLLSLDLIPEKFSGKVVVTFKEGGISFLERTETFK